MFGNPQVVAASLDRELRLDSRRPAAEWQLAEATSFSADWQGKNSDPEIETQVRLLWTPATLYMRFVCHYRELFVFDDCDSNGRRDHLWDRDVAEVFLQPDRSPQRYYKEFEVAPNGTWIDLDISPSGISDLKSGLNRSVHIDETERVWVAEMAIPMHAIAAKVQRHSQWRANFYRVEGRTEPRQYLAWQPTNTPKPNFHVPEAFGTMLFE